VELEDAAVSGCFWRHAEEKFLGRLVGMWQLIERRDEVESRQDTLTQSIGIYGRSNAAPRR
jgi:hypothetical protein